MTTGVATPLAPCRSYGMVEFRAMASPCRIVTDDDDLARTGVDIVRELESKWSRFRADSEISCLNRAGGDLCVLSPETVRLLGLAETARRLTGGLFEPLMLERMRFIESTAAVGVVDAVNRPPVRSITDGAIVTIGNAAALPPGAAFDPGGIGKGLAGDIVVERLLAAGATTVQVELGGDVRLAGESWTGRPWEVIVVDPRDRSAQIAVLTVGDGAVATSSSLGCRWGTGPHALHHLIDPRTGWPTDSAIVSVTAVSSQLWWAEVAAKVVLIAGPGESARLMEQLSVTGLTLDRGGHVSGHGLAEGRRA